MGVAPIARRTIERVYKTGRMLRPEDAQADLYKLGIQCSLSNTRNRLAQILGADPDGIMLPCNRQGRWYIHGPDGIEACVLRRTQIPANTVEERVSILFHRELVIPESIRAMVIKALMIDGSISTNELASQLGRRTLDMRTLLGKANRVLAAVGLSWHSRVVGGSKNPRLKAHELRMDIGSELLLYREAAISKADGIVRNREVAEEIVNDRVTEIIYKVEHEGLEIDNVKSYLLSAVQNRALNYLRDQRRRANLGEQNSGIIVPAGFASPDAFHGHDFDTMIADLSPIHRQVLILAFIESLTDMEIAEQLGVSRGTVVSRKSRALAQLRRDYSTL